MNACDAPTALEQMSCRLGLPRDKTTYTKAIGTRDSVTGATCHCSPTLSDFGVSGRALLYQGNIDIRIT
jgi:hypothetical protein